MPAEIIDPPPSADTIPASSASESALQAAQEAMKKKFTDLLSGAGGQQGAPQVQAPPAQPQGQPPAPPSSPVVPQAAPSAPSATDPASQAAPLSDLPPSGASKATKEHWERFRALSDQRVAAAREEAKKFQAELETLRKAPPVKGVPPEEVERLKAEKADLEASLERVALASSPRFKAHYDGGIAKQVKLAKSVAGPLADEVGKLLLEPSSPARNKRLEEIRSELGIDGQVILHAAATVRQLQLEREEQLENHAENLKLLKAREEIDATEGERRNQILRHQRAEAVLSKAKALPEFTAAPTDKAHQDFSTSALAFIQEALAGRLSPSDADLLPVAAMQAQYYEKIKVPALEAEKAALQARLDAYTSTSPRINGQAKEQGKPSLTEKAATYDPMEAVREVQRKFREGMAGMDS